MPDIILRSGDASPANIILRDPNALDGGGAVTATLTVNLSSLVLAGVATVSIQATASVAVGPATVAANVAVAVGATLNQSLADLTESGSAQILVGASLNQSLAEASAVAGATVAIGANLSIALEAVSEASSTQVPSTASLIAALQDLGIAGYGTLDLYASFATQLDPVFLSSDVTISAPLGLLSASLNVTLDHLLVSGICADNDRWRILEKPRQHENARNQRILYPLTRTRRL